MGDVHPVRGKHNIKLNNPGSVWTRVTVEVALFLMNLFRNGRAPELEIVELSLWGSMFHCMLGTWHFSSGI